MNKPSLFLWAYNAAELRPDVVMTRERAATMLRGWRSKRAEGYTVLRLKSEFGASYRVQVGALFATMLIRKHPEA